MKILKTHEIIPGKLYQRGEFLDLPLNFKLRELKRLGVQVVVNLWHKPDLDLQKVLPHYYHIPIPDNHIKKADELLAAAQEVAELMRSGCGVLTHCHAGRNRSGLFSALLCMQFLGMSSYDAIEYVRKKRPNALANKEFVEFIISQGIIKKGGFVAEQKKRIIVAIGGVPGCGKTALLREFMKGMEWKCCEPAKLLNAMYNEKQDLYVLGKYENGEVFAGTDKLSMAVQPSAQEWISECKSNVLFEGDRLFNKSFLDFLNNLPDTKLQIIYLQTTKDILKERYKDRCSNQSQQFIKGRETKYINLQADPRLKKISVEFPHSTLEDQDQVLDFLDKIFSGQECSAPKIENNKGIRKFF